MVLSFKVRTIGTDFETSMIVSKFRNAPENLKILVFRVTPDEGITPETVERIA
jgi:archaellum biogenesis ATPase FlaH